MNNKGVRFIKSAKAISFAIILLIAVALFAGRSQADSVSAGSSPEVRAGEVIVELKPGASIDAVNARFQTTTIRKLYGTNFYLLKTYKSKKESKWRKKLEKDADVLSATLNPVVTSPLSLFGRAVQDFPDGRPRPGQRPDAYNSQPLIDNLSEAHLRSRGEGVIVAVIDTGIDRAHPALASNIWANAREVERDNFDNDANGLVDDYRGWDFVDNDDNPTDEPGDPQSTVAGHGTFIAGLIALVAPRAQIMSVRAFNREGVGDAFTVAEAIKYAADHGARVINLSFGSPEDSAVLHDAVAYARGRGSLLVAAVGNENKSMDNGPEFPASWKDEVMGVAAIDQQNRRAAFSNFGSNVSVSAPGVQLVSIYPSIGNNNDYAIWSGTSFAAPLAAAEAALILGFDPKHDNTRGTIENTAINIDSLNPNFSGRLGRGRINPLAALQSLAPMTISHRDISLIAMGVEPAAHGKAEITITTAEQELEIEASELGVRAGYKIIIDGVVLVDGNDPNDFNREKARTSNFGGFKIEFSTAPSGNDIRLPAALDPVSNVRQVEIRDGLNRVVLQSGAGPIGGGAGERIEKEAELVSTGVLSRAEGRARAKVESEREELRVEGEDLISGASYEVRADGVSVGFAVAQSGYFRIELTSDGSSGRLIPQSLRPVTRIQRIEVRDQSGQVVLQGSFQAGSVGSGDDDDDDDDGDDDGGGSGGGSGSGSGGGSGGGGSGSGSGDGGGSGGDRDVRKEIDLNRTGIDSNASGRARVRLDNNHEELEIDADRLDPNSEYTIIVDGFSLGSFATDSSGELELDFGNDGSDLFLPSELRPVTNIRHVEIRNASGSTVLSGVLPA